MATKEEKITLLRTLTRNEIEVLYYFCQGKTDKEMTVLFDVSGTKTVGARWRLIFNKLAKNLPNDEKRDFVRIEYCDIVQELVPTEESLRLWAKTPTTVNSTTETESTSATSEAPEQQPTRSGRSLTFLGCVILSCLFLAAVTGVGFAIYRYFQGQDTVTPSPTQDNVTTPAATSPLVPTEPTTTSIAPSEAPPPVDTPIPTPDFYTAGQAAILRDDVTVTLDPVFHLQNGGCIAPESGFVVMLLINNRSGTEFLIRFDPRAFSAMDDTGKVYELTGAGVDRCNAVGPQTIQAKTDNALYLRFAGEIPLEATYIVITADSLSGFRLIFRKPL
jgi:hypothetical protein